LIVTNSNDSGSGSLREAIELANLEPGNNLIEFDPSLAGQKISLSSGELLISDQLGINGLGADQLTVDAQGNSKVFFVDDGDSTSDIEVNLNGLTITGAVGGYFGSGISNSENLTITNSNITGNSARGIFNTR
jgi:hypothetical protein